jgi:hypothetical protein
MKKTGNSESDDSDESDSHSDEKAKVVKKVFTTKDKNEIIKNFSKKEICYYKMIHRFFESCNIENMTKMVSIINGESDISLRVLDWFVTKYSKKRIECGQNKESEVFDIRISYKSQLKAYKKRYFDPFRRRKKFYYHFDGKKIVSGEKDITCVETTLGQLNFFKWAISNDILTYVETNIGQITKAMNLSNKEDKKRRTSDEKPVKKNNKKTVKINAVKTTKQDEIEIVLTFD